MLRPLVSRATSRRRSALTALLLAAALGCQPARQPLPLDGEVDAGHEARLDAGEALAAVQDDDRDAPPGDAAAVKPPPRAGDDEANTHQAAALREEDLPELDLPPAASNDQPTTDAGAPPPAAPSGFTLEAPSPLTSLTAATPPNVAAATRLTEAARLRLAAGDDGAALEQLERAIAIDSGNPYAYYFLAELHLRHRTYDQAIAFADRAAELSRADPQWTSRALELQGNAFEAAGRFSDARQAYLRAVRAAPNNLAALSGLARTGAPPPGAAAP